MSRNYTRCRWRRHGKWRSAGVDLHTKIVKEAAKERDNVSSKVGGSSHERTIPFIARLKVDLVLCQDKVRRRKEESVET